MTATDVGGPARTPAERADRQVGDPAGGHPSIEVVLLGTGSPLPDPDRAGPAALVVAGSSRFLVDAGRGVLLRLAGAGVGPAQLDAVLLTHLHSDHLTDLNDVITTRWVQSFSPSPLRIVGPARTDEVVEGILAALRPDIDHRLAHHADLTWAPPVDVDEVTDGTVHDDGGVRVLAAPTDHRPVTPTVGYRIEYGGAAVVLAGDTVPCEGLDRLCEGADVLVHTVVRPDVLLPLGVQRFAEVCDYHSSVEQAADTAARAGVGTLVLTHCVPAVPMGGEQAWRDLATSRFGGEVVVARDLDRVTATARP